MKNKHKNDLLFLEYGKIYTLRMFITQISKVKTIR